MKMKFCPKYGNTGLVMVAGAELGILECKVCGYHGVLFPEREIQYLNKLKTLKNR